MSCGGAGTSGLELTARDTRDERSDKIRHRGRERLQGMSVTADENSTVESTSRTSDAHARLAQFLRVAAGARSLEIARFERLSGGAVQENWALDVEVTGSAHAGSQRWVLRTDAPATVAMSSRRSDEFR